ncbi:MAG: DUF6895 family protein [Rhodanobacteraceae bacterium]
MTPSGNQVGAPTQAFWPREDLTRRLVLALKIARRTIGFLGLDGYRGEEVSEDSFGPDKPLAETAMLLYVSAATGGVARRELQIDDLCLLLVPLARSVRTALAIALHPTICFQLAMPHILLTRLGLEDARFDRLLALSSDSPASRGREILAHRALEGCWLRSAWSAAAPSREFADAVANSVMSHPLDLLWGSRDDAYAYTHTFMYFSDFGRSLPPLPRARSELVEESTALLMRSLLVEDFDLAAEVLMTWPLMCADWTPAATFGFRVLAELEDRVGFLPAGNGVPEKFQLLNGAERTKYALAASYHTAYVMGMLCALAVGPGRAPPTEIIGPLVPATLVETLLSMIPAADTPWQTTFRKLRVEEQRTLAPVLLDIALLTKVRSHDLSCAAGLLDIAVGHDLADTPICAQAAQLIQRVAACTD